MFTSASRRDTTDLQKELGIVEELRGGRLPVVPFHWEIEFPEVFARENPGFDSFVGNPPFGGKNTIINSHRDNYLPYLQTIHEETHGNADLVCHFFRRSFGLLRQGGTFGLIATNTIAQGDTRASGLRWICTHGGAIYEARKRVKWPGQAAVVVSVVHVEKGSPTGPFDLDGRSVPIVTAFLFHAGGHDNPADLRSNDCKSYIGTYVLGMGFTFDDDNPRATPLSEMQRLIRENPSNRSIIEPYLGGEELNESPTQSPHRFVINFGEMTEQEARRWPALMEIVETKVKPERLKQKDEGARKKWWQFIRPRRELYEAIKGQERILVIARISQTCAFTFVRPGQILNEKIVVFTFDQHSAFAILQSRVHEIWARFFSTTLKDDLQYTPSDCFETFPFPPAWDSNNKLLELGMQYDRRRIALMSLRNEGLTAIYSRFSNPDENDAGILELRRLHAAMDRAVLDSYGWTDLNPTCEFLPEFADAAQGDEAQSRKKRWRYRWPDDTRDTVLGRLLDFNRQRAQEEAITGGAEKSAGNQKPVRGAKKRLSTNPTLGLNAIEEAKQ